MYVYQLRLGPVVLRFLVRAAAILPRQRSLLCTPKSSSCCYRWCCCCFSSGSYNAWRSHCCLCCPGRCTVSGLRRSNAPPQPVWPVPRVQCSHCGRLSQARNLKYWNSIDKRTLGLLTKHMDYLVRWLVLARRSAFTPARRISRQCSDCSSAGVVSHIASGSGLCMPVAKADGCKLWGHKVRQRAMQ